LTSEDRLPSDKGGVPAAHHKVSDLVRYKEVYKKKKSYFLMTRNFE
jgi:hypothetical protein